MSEDENIYIDDNDIQSDGLNNETESAGSETTGSAFGGLNEYSNLNNYNSKDNMPNRKNHAANFAKNLGNLASKRGKGEKVPEALKNRKNPTPPTNGKGKSGNKDKNNDKESQTQNGSVVGQASGKNKEKGKEKSAIDNVAEKAAEKGGSAVLQYFGVPKGAADLIAKKLAGPAVKIAKKRTKMAIITSVASIFLTFLIIVVSIGIILMPILKGLELINDISDEFSNFFSSAGHWISGDGWCASDAECITKAEDEFYEKVEKVSEKYPNVDMPLVLSSVLYGLNTEGKFNVGNVDYCEQYTDATEKKNCQDETFTTEESEAIESNADLSSDEKIEAYKTAKSNISKVAKKLSKGKDEFDKYMVNTFIPKNYKEYITGGTTAQKILDEIYLLANLFNDFKNMLSFSTSGRICTYTVGGKDLKNIKIRLLACKGAEVEYGEVLPDEELIDLETYVLGGTAQEIGTDSPEHAIKTQAIAIRSYVLRRSEEMGGAYNLDIDYANNIVNIRACTDDLAYCDPNKGCWSNGQGGEGQQTIHSGVDKTKSWYKDPIPEDAKIREYVAATAGMVGLQSTGKIAYTPFMQPEQLNWISWANSGMDYTEILKKEYTGDEGDPISTIKANCTSGLSGEWDTWRQCDDRWGSVPLGNTTICKVGCLITSIAIQIARSGTPITLPPGVSEFNPGTFVQHSGIKFSSGGGYLGGDQWTESMAPGFVRAGDLSISGTKKQKIAKVAEYINQGYYLVTQVKYAGGTHFVAVVGTTADDIIMIDPASDSTELFAKYPSGASSSVTFTGSMFKTTN